MLVPLFRFLSIFPLSVLHAAGAALGWLVYAASPSYRRRMRDNLRQAGYGDYLNAAIGEAGKSMFELPFIWCADPARVSRHATLENWALVQTELDAGRGIVFMTPHLGCFEIVAQEIALRNELMVMYRPPKKAALKPLIEGARARHNLLLAPANMSGVRMLAKFLKKGQPVGVLPDQVPQEGEGVWATFFGRDAYTMTLPAKLALLGDATVIITYAERLPGGKGYVVRFVPFDGSLDGDSAAQAQAINHAMERLIARNPSQYYWSYNRYKVPNGIDAPSATKAGENA
ncbi:lysophospholipid acyltransferase family protein [Duganella sp. FT50W]|uniref:Lysophospholipid acyltransferase family protein n=1 Tax=Duganella lactea TaxID=2692173 RepID=A0A6L8MDI2_9BURK|nr:lysophospholipid acyltransferase family protein [Duganella lactea]MYM80850.1 lysophospholipid acyltransferase family protein [Duganella lactea]